ncbi:tyrosine-protein phosphatase [Curvibacter gracilis]|uniref:tyrosine-protein phosphatase n=1 Tax=Curvibacter gracilis TaxID=230310 RepID=UPI0004BCF30A|nr:CpsB/CapC family capsule biosynthesis tyrosine phosphatase [Curvibacter gracilis]
MTATTGIIDLHCHFLHGIDDGARNLNEALDLARAAVADGITASAMTPHIHPGRYPNQKSVIAVHVQAFQQALNHHGIPLAVYPGAELRASDESLSQLQAQEVPFLGEYKGLKILLLEFPHQGLPAWGLGFVYRLLEQGIRPLIAHPERNKQVMANVDRIQPYLAAGCWLQVTGGSLLGQFGKASEKAAWALMEQDAVNVVASDAHNLDSRPPHLKAALEAVAAEYGERRAERLFKTTPAQILGLG